MRNGKPWYWVLAGELGVAKGRKGRKITMRTNDDGLNHACFFHLMPGRLHHPGRLWLRPDSAARGRRLCSRLCCLRGRLHRAVLPVGLGAGWGAA